MKIYDVSRLPSQIVLGWDGENNWRPIAFDCSALLTGHPNAVVTLWLLPKGESQAFLVALERDGDTVVWTPLNEEMTAERGQLQIVVQDDTDVGKSRVIDYTVHDSLVGGADHPAETPSWATQVVADVTEAASHYPRIGDNGNWFVWDITAGEWVDTGVAAGGGDISPEDIAEAVEDYFDGNPIDYPVDSVNGKTGAVTLSASDVHALPDDTVIPDAVTEQDVAGWGFTKNTGTYSKPSGGIPKTDLASAVQTSLGKADTALQEHQSLTGYATETWVGQQGYQTAQQVQAAISPLQTKAITDTGNYYTTDTVDGALQEIGAELSGVNTLIGSGVIS